MKLLTLIYIIPFVICAQLKVGAKAEYNKAKLVVMHQPDYELYYGVVHPHAALFDTYFDRTLAKVEHQNFQNLLSKKNIDILTVQQILLKNTLDKNNQAKPGKSLLELQKFARTCIEIDTVSKSYLGLKEYKQQQEYLDDVFSKMHPYDLIKTILLQPSITLKRTNTNTYTSADYKVRPVMNLYFSRDQMITTPKGIVLSSLNSVQRSVETKILKFCLQKLDIPTLLDLSEEKYKNCFLEGGDYFSFGNTSLIGQGMRTNREAIKELMKQDVFGTKYVAIVKDSYFYQPQMHLDTYFNVIDSDLVTVSKKRYMTNVKESKAPVVDLFVKRNKEYVLEKKDLTFKKYLSKYLKAKVLVISDEDQENYGLNFLCIGPREIVAVRGQSAAYISMMKKHNVKINWVDFTNLKQGWGAAHCTTQVIIRE